jgi:hypothetical protein
MLSKTKTQFNFNKPRWNHGPKSIKQVYLFIPTSKKIKSETKTHKNILKIKKKVIFLPKNLPKTQEKKRFKRGKNNGSKYMY